MGSPTEVILAELAALAASRADLSESEAVRIAGRGAQVLIQLVIRLLEGRTTEQAVEILEHLVETGAKPISALELAAQTADVLKELGQKP
jgi:hypothetical protein